MYPVDYSYFIFPIFSLLPLKKNKKNIILTVYLILYLGFSKIGKDRLGYMAHYIQHMNKAPLKSIHGEILFKLYMRVFVNLGIDYEIFRAFHIILFLIIICFFLYKISNNYTQSLFILYCGYIIYLCSGYRQMVSIAFVFWSINLMKNNKINMAILLNLIGMGFHISSIYPLICMIFIKFKKRIKLFTTESYFILMIIAYIFRILVLNSENLIYKVLLLIGREKYFYHYIENCGSMIDFGILTRVIPLTLIILLYKRKNTFENKIFLIYMISVILYIAIPFSLLAGRLFNNGRVLESLLFPIVIEESNSELNKKYLNVFVIVYFILVLLTQLLRQSGYYPYVNILF